MAKIPARRVRGKNLPRGISLTPEGIYYVRVSFDGKQYSIGRYETLTLARAALDMARMQVVTRTFIPPAERKRLRRAEQAEEQAQALTVRQWSAEWLEQLERGGRSPSTITSYASVLRAHILGPIGDKRLTAVTEDDCHRLMDAVPTDAVKFNVARTLTAMLNAAVKIHAGNLAVSPAHLPVDRLARSLHRDDELDSATIEQVWAIYDRMDKRYRVAVWLAVGCGLRLAECLGLQRRDLDLADQDNAVLHVRRQWLTKRAGHPDYAPPKVDSVGDESIPHTVAVMLAEHVKRYVGDDPDAPILPSPADPRRPISQSMFDRLWRDARDPVAPALHFHSLRHVHLSLYARDATPQETAHRGRHKSLAVAARYQLATRERDRENTQALDRLLRRSPHGASQEH